MPEPVPEHAEVEHAEEAAVDGTAGAGFLMPRRPAGEQPELAEEPALAGTTAGGAGFLMPRRPTGEARDAWGADGVDEELPVMALLMPRLAMDDHPPVVQTHPTEGGEEEAGEGVALLWKRLAGLVGPRPLPDVRGGGAPHPLPLHPRPAVHLNPAHMEPHHMPHPHHMLQHMPHPHHMPHHPPHAWPLLTETGELVAETPDGRWFELRTLDDPGQSMGRGAGGRAESRSRVDGARGGSGASARSSQCKAASARAAAPPHDACPPPPALDCCSAWLPA